MSRRVLPHGACLLPARRAVNRTRTLVAPPAFVASGLHGTSKPLAQQEESNEASSSSATPTTTTAVEGGRGVLGSLPARTAASRVGRGVLVALPVVGGGFAAHLAREDSRRALRELKSAHVRLALAEMEHQRDVSRTAGQAPRGGGVVTLQRPTLEASAARCFGVTAAIDSGVVAAHALTLYGLYQGWDPDPIVNAGIAAAVGALFSTGGGVRGEYLVASRELLESRAKRSQARSDGGGEGDTAGG